jgi:hypothetical protein
MSFGSNQVYERQFWSGSKPELSVNLNLVGVVRERPPTVFGPFLLLRKLDELGGNEVRQGKNIYESMRKTLQQRYNLLRF